MLHSRLLRYLDEVARYGSIRQAAERLNVAPSSINRQILALEEELGTPIFHRLPRKLRLTTAGELLIAHVRQTLKEHGRFQSRVEDLKGIQAGQVRIAAMGGLSGGILPSVVAAFRRSYPRVLISVRSLFAEEIIAGLIGGDADLGLGYNMPDDPRLAVRGTFRTRLGAVVSPRHPLALRAPVRLADCLDYPTVLGDPSMTINRLITSAFSRAGLDFKPTYLSNSHDYMKQMARSDEAVTFLDRIDVLEDQRRGLLVYLPIQDSHLQGQNLALVRPARGGLERAVDLIEEEILAFLGHVQDGTIRVQEHDVED